jgi:hypothetical protein
LSNPKRLDRAYGYPTDLLLKNLFCDSVPGLLVSTAPSSKPGGVSTSPNGNILGGIISALGWQQLT